MLILPCFEFHFETLVSACVILRRNFPSFRLVPPRPVPPRPVSSYLRFNYFIVLRITQAWYLKVSHVIVHPDGVAARRDTELLAKSMSTISRTRVASKGLLENFYAVLRSFRHHSDCERPGGNMEARIVVPRMVYRRLFPIDFFINPRHSSAKKGTQLIDFQWLRRLPVFHFSRMINGTFNGPR